MTFTTTKKVLLATAVSSSMVASANIASAADLDQLSDNELLERIERLEKLVGKGDKNVVRSGNSKIRVTVNGQINEVVRYSTNGEDSALQVLDNDASSSRFRILGEGKVNDEFKIKTAFEFDTEVNPRDELDQDDNFNLSAQVSSSANFEIRKAEVIFDHKRFGRVFLGQGDTFSNKIVESDLSGATLAVSDFSFDDDSLDFFALGENVGDILDPLDGLSRQTRIRYDTPKIAGFRIGATYVTDRTYDVGVEYANKDLAGFSVKGRAAYFAFLDSGAVDPTVQAQSRAASGSLSVLHKGTGLSLSGFVSSFFDDASATADEDEYFAWGIKGGYQTKIFDFGKTAFGVDYSRHDGTPEAEDFAALTTNQLEAFSVGVQVTQKIDKASTELYLGYRLFSVDSDFEDGAGGALVAAGAPLLASPLEDIHVVAAGARVKF